jgi:hypothetical protein
MHSWNDGRAQLLAPPETEMEEKLWTWAEEGGERLPLVTLGEARAAMYLLQTLASGDSEGHEIAFHLASALARRIPCD